MANRNTAPNDGEAQAPPTPEGTTSEALSASMNEVAEADGANVEFTEFSPSESQKHAADFFAGKLSAGVFIRFESRGGQTVAVATKRA